MENMQPEEQATRTVADSFNGTFNRHDADAVARAATVGRFA